MVAEGFVIHGARQWEYCGRASVRVELAVPGAVTPLVEAGARQTPHAPPFLPPSLPYFLADSNLFAMCA